MKQHTEQPVSDIPAKLRSLREAAGLSVREIAAELGWPHTTYSTYEGRFKKHFLPIDKARPIADVLVRYGIPAGDVLALAGVGGAEGGESETSLSTSNRAPLDYVAVTVVAMLESTEEWRKKLSNEQIGNGVALFCRWYDDEVALGRQPQRLTLQNAKSLMGLLMRGGMQIAPTE